MLYSKPFQYSVSTKKIPFQANEITEYILISDELMSRSHRATIIKSVFWCSTWTSNAFAGRYLETNSGNCSSQTDQVTHVTHNAQVLRMNSSTSPRIQQSGIYSHFEIAHGQRHLPQEILLCRLQLLHECYTCWILVEPCLVMILRHRVTHFVLTHLLKMRLLHFKFSN